MQSVLGGVTQWLDASRQGYYEIVDHKLSLGGETLGFVPILAGEVHVLAFHYDRDLKIEVRDSDGYLVSNESPYGEAIGQMFMDRLGWSTRAFRARAGGPVQVKLLGQGCALLVVVRRW